MIDTREISRLVSFRSREKDARNLETLDINCCITQEGEGMKPQILRKSCERTTTRHRERGD